MSYQPPFYKQIFHDTRRIIAGLWLNSQPAMQIAVTGSQGKTNTAQTIAKALSVIDKTIVTDANLDTVYNVPITALKTMPWTKYAVFELGVDHPGEMAKHLQIVKPKIGVITGISPVHTDKEHLGSLANLIGEKRKLIEALPANGFAILNYDDENVRKMAPYTKAKILWYGTDKKHCDVWADNVQVSLQETAFALHTTYEVVQAQTRLIGKHHIYTVMVTYLILEAIKKLTGISFPMNRFIGIIKNLSSFSGRMSVESGPLGAIVLNDSLRANPTSTASGLQTLNEINLKKGRKIAVLAEMGELENPETEHKKIGHLIGKLRIDFLVAIGPLQKYVAEEAVRSGMKKDRVFWVKDIFAAAEILKKIIKQDDLIYLKGSLLRHVERVLLILGGVKVGCAVTVCDFYHRCHHCRYLEIGYNYTT